MGGILSALVGSATHSVGLIAPLFAYNGILRRNTTSALFGIKNADSQPANATHGQ